MSLKHLDLEFDNASPLSRKYAFHLSVTDLAVSAEERTSGGRRGQSQAAAGRVHAPSLQGIPLTQENPVAEPLHSLDVKEASAVLSLVVLVALALGGNSEECRPHY